MNNTVGNVSLATSTTLVGLSSASSSSSDTVLVSNTCTNATIPSSTTTTTTTTADGNSNRRPGFGKMSRNNNSVGGTNHPRTGGSTSSSNTQHQQYNPKLITAQIVALQCFHYSLLAVFFQVNHVLYGTSITIDRIFTDQYVRTSFSVGLIDSMAMVLSSILGAFLLAIIVEKSKKCLDFACTLFLVHLLFCTIYSGRIPSRSDWWIVNIFGTIVMVVLGEYICSRRELDDIPLLQL